MRNASTRVLALTGLLVLLCAAGYAQVVKQANGYLDTLAFKDFALGTKSQPVALTDCIQALPNKTAWTSFIRQHGQVDAHVDAYTGMPVLVNGTRLPWVTGDPFSPAQTSAMALKARTFLAQNKELFQNMPMDYLVLNPQRSGALGEDGYLWFVDFDFVYMGVPIDGARLVFRCNHGNMVQFGMEGIIPFSDGMQANLNPYPFVSAQQALDIAFGYAGGFDDRVDTVLNPGTLKFMPRLKSSGVNAIGSRYEYPLVWEVAFTKQDVTGSWKVWVDAHSGQVLSFFDDNDYGVVKGGVYPVSQTVSTEVLRGLPFADVNTGVYANWAGKYTTPASGSVVSKLQGKYVKIVDSCGAASLSGTAPNDLNFSSSSGTDCTTPGVGGAGNTHAARSCFYHIANIKYKAMQWLPSNTWMTGQITANMNLNQTCNAYWNGSSINFFRSGGGCGNTGEIAAIFLHEFGHGLDSNDGGPSSDKSTGETYGDSLAALQTHNSCGGPGFLGSNCSGYGDACTNCTGVRELDYAKHSSGQPHTIAQTMGTTGFKCPTSSSYYGPCGREGHCESYPATEAMWDIANRDLVTQGLDVTTGWFVLDRLFFLSRSTSGSAYTCNTSTKTGSGCSASNWHQTFLVVDDNDGNLTNGTPHAGAIMNAFNRHGLACTTSTSTNSTSCGTVGTPTVTATAGNNSVGLSWAATTGAAKYYVLRNDLGCNNGYIKVAETTSTSYTDGDVANGMTYYYRVVAVASSASCFSALSACQTVTPTGGGTPTYTISGTVTGATSVAVNLSGAASSSTTTDGSGNYSFPGLANGSYTVTPSKTGYTFTPTSIAVTISGADQGGKNFTGTGSGGTDTQLTSGVGVAGSVAQGAWKYYYITVPSGATSLVFATTGSSGDVDIYTQVTNKPTSSSYVCRPYSSSGNETCTQANPTAGTWYCGVYGYAAGSYTITATVTTGTVTYSISGTITNGASATVNLTGAAAKTTTADASGNYTFTGLANGSYTVTPSKTGCTFSPTSIAVTISGANQTGKNFTATCGTPTYSISGTITGGASSTVNLTGAATASTTADASGNYSFAGLVNGSYTVTPSKSGCTFSPTSIAVTIAGANQTGKNFTATCGTGDTQLTSGVAVTGQSVAQGAWKYYYITVPSGATSLELKTTASTGDVDIYTQYNAKPTASTYLCRPYTGSGDETCTQASPTAGTWWLGVYGYAAGSFTVTGTVTTGGGGPTTLFTNGLDATTGWAQVDTSGTTGTWSIVTSGTYPTVTRHGGTAMAKFNSYNATSGNATRYYRSAGFSTSAYTTITLTFWMYHDTGYSSSADKIQVQVSNAGGAYTSVGTAINRYDGSTGWKQHTVNLSAYKYADLRLGFLATSAYGNNMFIDDVLVTGSTGAFASMQEETPMEVIPMDELPVIEGSPEPVEYEIQ